MSTVSLALAGLKTALQSIDPAPQPAPNAVYLWPDDYDIMDTATFPFIIVAQVVNRWLTFGDETHGTRFHPWLAEINICLANGPLTKFEIAQQAESKQVPWLLALATTLSANRSLGATAVAIGSGDQLFRYRIGHIGWDKGKVFWGVRAEIQVYQQHSLAAS